MSLAQLLSEPKFVTSYNMPSSSLLGFLPFLVWDKSQDNCPWEGMDESQVMDSQENVSWFLMSLLVIFRPLAFAERRRAAAHERRMDMPSSIVLFPAPFTPTSSVS
jgi:hypothetical protein